ncbi:MAG: hypothetical protein NZ890_18620 [Myxococcota bacterium]|nr:hypothetical protein [Myxococcota bacterium]
MTQHREGPPSPAAPRRRLLGQTLIERGLLGAAELRTWLAAQSALPPDRPVRRLGSLLVEAGVLELDQLAEVLGQLRHVRAASCTMDQVEPQLQALFPLETLRRIEAVPLFRAGRTVAVAMADPHNAEQVAELERLCGQPIEPLQAPQLYIQRLLRDFQTQAAGATPDPSAEPAPATAPPPKRNGSLDPDVPPGSLARMPAPPTLQPDHEGPGFHLQVRPARVDRVAEVPRRAPSPIPRGRPTRDGPAKKPDGDDAGRRLPREAGPRLGPILLIALLFQLTGIGMGFWMGAHYRTSGAAPALPLAVAGPVQTGVPVTDRGGGASAVAQTRAQPSASPAEQSARGAENQPAVAQTPAQPSASPAAPPEQAPAPSLQPAAPPGPSRGLRGPRKKMLPTRSRRG